MSADYYIYTEVQRNDGVWHALNGLYFNEKENKHKMVETYHNGSRSYFSATYNKLRDIGTTTNISNVSSEVIACNDWAVEDEVNAVVVSLKSLREALPRGDRKQCCGYVLKQDIWEYENNGAEIENWVGPYDYRELADDEKKFYEFYEWDDPFGWVTHLIDILRIVSVQLDLYQRANYMWDEPDNVRIICIVSC